MPQLLELKQQHHAAISKAESIIAAAENAGRALTPAEDLDIDSAMAEAQALAPQISTIQKRNTLSVMMSNGKLLPAARSQEGSYRPDTPSGKKVLGENYLSAFLAWLGTGGQQIDAALYEGTGSAGGYAVPVTVDDQIVPLAAQETAIRQLATVIPTTSDIKIPRQTSFSGVAIKAESGASSNSFGETDPTLDQVTLSAFMAGGAIKLSWELTQDVAAFQSFAITDLLKAMTTLEETLYVSGSGTGQAQGMLGNVGTGLTGIGASTTDNYASELLAATLDLVGTLNSEYHDNASFLMARPTSVVIRQAQRAANLYEPVFTRVGNQDYLHGYPVRYAAAMPVVAAGATPLLFGDFKAGYIIGDRGGSGINVKILDQPFAMQGQVGLLVYRRMDGRVRRSEAIQPLTLHS